MEFSRNEDTEHKLLKEMQIAMYDGDRKQPSVSGMIYCLTKTYYEANLIIPDSEGRKIPNNTKSQLLLFVTGLGLEKVLLSGRQVSESGEYDGIQWHVDHFGGTDGDFIEVKSTRARSNKNPEKPYTSEGWIKQILSYAKVTGIRKGTLTILHLFGSGSPPFPDLLCWDFELTDAEVDENWNWIKARRDTYLDFVSRGEPPTPFMFNKDWECENCNWKGYCEAQRLLGAQKQRLI